MSLQKYHWSMLFNVSVSERYIRYIYGKNQDLNVEDNVKVRAKQIDFLFSVKRWNLLICLFLPYDRLANVSISLCHTLIFFRNIRFGLLFDTYWLAQNRRKKRVLLSNITRQFKCVSKDIFLRGSSTVNLLHICRKPLY